VAHAETASGTLRTVRNAAGLRDILGSRQRPAGARTPARPWDRWLLAAIYSGLNHANVRLRLWDGTSCGPIVAGGVAGRAPEHTRQQQPEITRARVRDAPPAPADPVATVVIHDRGALFDLAWQPDIAFGDGYASGRIDVDGDLVALLEELYRGKPDADEPSPATAWLRRVFFSPNALDRARDNIHHHYDIGNAFYQLWLDREMVYTCAYFPEPTATLEEAQIAKMEHVCRKLRLRPGERVIEAGCGWGALARYMASRYGVYVRAFNISREQIDYARERARLEGLADRVEFIEDDYRNIAGNTPPGTTIADGSGAITTAATCDAFASIGMLEHVGRDYFPALSVVIDRVLAPDRGRGLLHFIGRNTPAPLHPWIERRIFPGAYPPTLAEVAEGVFAPARLTILDAENLRLHYARTLQHWLARFEARVGEVTAMFDDAFAHAWRLYLAGSIASFTTGSMQLFQVTFARERDNNIPWTREYIYNETPHPRPLPGEQGEGVPQRW
jgi:cyclopropane-fatty-acyl-phospholipid synthase